MRWALAALALVLAGCADETISGYAAPGPWRLVSIDGEPYPAEATMDLSVPGRVSGRGPCNGWSAAQRVPYPWFEIGPVTATRMACPALADEAAFFGALEAMELAEASGDVLVLSTADGREMEFRRQP